MKLELFEKGYEGKDLVLFYGNEPLIIKRLIKSINSLLVKKEGEISIHDTEGVDSINNCKVFGVISPKDYGLQNYINDNSYILKLTDEGWEQVIDYLKPFCKKQLGHGVHFQYISDEGKVILILSNQRDW